MATTRQSNIVRTSNRDPRTNLSIRKRQNRTRIIAETRGRAEDLIESAVNMKTSFDVQDVKSMFTEAYFAIQDLFKLDKGAGHKLLVNLKAEQVLFNKERKAAKIKAVKDKAEAKIEHQREASFNETARQEGLNLGRQFRHNELAHDAKTSWEGMRKAIEAGIIEDPFAERNVKAVRRYDEEKDRVTLEAPTPCTFSMDLSHFNLPTEEETAAHLAEVDAVATMVEKSLEEELTDLIDAIDGAHHLDDVRILVGEDRMLEDATEELIAEIVEAAEIVAEA